MDINKLNGIVKKTAVNMDVPHQNIYDMFFFERFLYRLSLSQYKTNFVIKGGFLLENIVGIKSRTTMDIDLKAVGIILSDNELVTVFANIAETEGNDEITYSVLGISDITGEMSYGGKTVKIEARLTNLKRIFSVDVSQGDVVTPYPQRYTYKSIVDDGEFELLAYTNETIIAEKFETLIAKGKNNSRAKDLFDIHILLKCNIDYDRLNAALINTFYVRGTRFDKESIKLSLDAIYSSAYRREVFDRYVKKHSFASGLSFDEVMQSAYAVCDSIKVCDFHLRKSIAKIALVRHGEDERDKVGGWSDNNLTEKGIMQVKNLVAELTGHYDVILSSDLPRARQTAEIIAEKLNCPIEYNEGLRETNNGDLKNLTKAEFKEQGYKWFIDFKMEENYPNGESPRAFYERIKETFVDILEKYEGKRVLLVTHGGVITVIQCLINGWQYSNMLKITPPYATKIDLL